MTDQTQQPARKQASPSTLQLTVPAQDSIENPNVETDQTRLIEWINNLPYANPLSTATELHESIFRLNRFPGTVHQRHELVNCYLAPFKVVYQSARKATQQKRVQTALKQTDIGPITIKITIELAYSYKLIINEHLQLNDISKDPQQFGNAIYSAMKAIALELMLEYSNLIPDSKKAWRELFQLYTLAEQYGLEKIPVEKGISIDHLFKRILLITIIDPYHLLQGEVWHCYNYLIHWSMKAQLHTLSAVPNDVTGLFLVDFHAMHPPSTPKPNDQLQQNQHRLLQVNSLNLVVHQQWRQLQENGSTKPKGTEELSKEQMHQMFRHMLLAWHIRPSRRSERHEKYGSRPATYGLSAINHFLKKGELIEDDDTAVTNSMDDYTLTLTETTSFHRENTHYPLYSWRIFNSSASGVGIIVLPPFPKDIQVGQLIMIELEGDAQQKQLKAGIVRRMIKRDANALEIGVQFLPGKISPISIRPYFYDKEITADFQHGILIDRGPKTSQALLTPNGMYQKQREFVLDNNNSIQRIISNNIIETSPVFDCFDYHEKRSSTT